MIDQCADDEGVDNADDGGLGGGADTGIDAAENDNGGEQRQEGLLERDPDFTRGGLGGIAVPAVLLGLIIADKHQQNADQNAGDNTGDKEVAYRAANGDSVQDKGNAGRDDDTNRTGAGRERGGEGGIILLFGHLGDHERTDRRNGRRTGAGDRRKEHAGDRRHVGKTAGDMADQLVEEVEQTAGDAAIHHEAAGHNEERDSKKRKRVKAGEAGLCQKHGRKIGREDHDRERAAAKSDTDGHTEDQKAKEATK